jgi:hypothetical protein
MLVIDPDEQAGAPAIAFAIQSTAVEMLPLLSEKGFGSVKSQVIGIACRENVFRMSSFELCQEVMLLP